MSLDRHMGPDWCTEENTAVCVQTVGIQSTVQPDRSSFLSVAK